MIKPDVGYVPMVTKEHLHEMGRSDQIGDMLSTTCVNCGVEGYAHTKKLMQIVEGTALGSVCYDCIRSNQGYAHADKEGLDRLISIVGDSEIPSDDADKMMAKAVIEMNMRFDDDVPGDHEFFVRALRGVKSTLGEVERDAFDSVFPGHSPKEQVEKLVEFKVNGSD